MYSVEFCLIRFLPHVRHRYPSLRHVHLHWSDPNSGRGVDALTKHGQRLREIYLRVEDETLQKLLDSDCLKVAVINLALVRPQMYERVMRRPILRLPRSFLHNALTTLTLSNSLKMADILEILILGSKLRVFHAPGAEVDGSEPETCPPWTSKDLRVLQLGLQVEGHVPHVDRPVFENSIKESEIVLARRANAARAMAAAIGLALSFMEQLVGQTQLCELELRFNSMYQCGISPFLSLARDSENGLWQLSRLNRLEKLAVSGLWHQLPVGEKEWMAKHWWPRAVLIDFTVFDASGRRNQIGYTYKYFAENHRPWSLD